MRDGILDTLSFFFSLVCLVERLHVQGWEYQGMGMGWMTPDDRSLEVYIVTYS